MDLDDFNTFLAVVRHSSFSRAAVALHRSQPGVSRQIQRLEADLGVPLLRRPPGPVEPTAAGDAVIPFANDLRARVDRLRSAVRKQDAALDGHLHIVASTTPGEFLVPTLIARFGERIACLQADVIIRNSASVPADLRRGAADVGFVGSNYPHRSLRYTVVAEDEVVLAVPADHDFAALRTVALPDIAGQPFVDREEGSGTRASVIRMLGQRRLRLPDYRVVMVLGTTKAVVSAVEQGYGIGWVSAMALQHRDARRVVPVRLLEGRLLRPLYMVHGPRRDLSPLARAFVDAVRAEAAPAGARQRGSTRTGR